MLSKKSSKNRSRSRKSKSRRTNSKKSKGKIRLLSIKKSPIKGKKLRANFSDGTHTDFGATGYGDYIQYSKKNKNHADMKRSSYIARHKVRENFSNYKSRGSLSRYVLWNKRSLGASIADYKRKFNL